MSRSITQAKYLVVRLSSASWPADAQRVPAVAGGKKANEEIRREVLRLTTIPSGLFQRKLLPVRNKHEPGDSIIALVLSWRGVGNFRDSAY
jgi:hypothetical protein